MRPSPVLFLLCSLSLFLPVTAFSQNANNGTMVSAQVSHQTMSQVTADGLGGSIVVWQDLRNNIYYDIFAQRLDASGSPLWAANGIPVCRAFNNQTEPQVIADGTGGAIVAWIDNRSGNTDIFVQRIDASGAPAWLYDGVPVLTLANAQLGVQLVSDGSGGTVLTWQDHRNGNADIFAQRFNASGAPLWTNDGVPICTHPSTQEVPMLVPDGTGGAVIVWQELRRGS